jgi:hypothetical protein
MPTDEIIQRVQALASADFLSFLNDKLIGPESLTAEILCPILESANWPVEIDARNPFRINIATDGVPLWLSCDGPYLRFTSCWRLRQETPTQVALALINQMNGAGFGVNFCYYPALHLLPDYPLKTNIPENSVGSSFVVYGEKGVTVCQLEAARDHFCLQTNIGMSRAYKLGLVEEVPV